VERRAALAAAAEAGQAELWPEHGQRVRRRQRPSRRRRQIFEASGGACFYCRAPINIETFEVDHMMPKALGGGDEGVNLAAACRQCNRCKSDRSAVEHVVARAGEQDR
jgi:5-methylcytosine-specific restriction endonuclease McrA